MRINRTVGAVERERERVEFRKTIFFCDAKKDANILKAEIINMHIDKTDYQEALEKFKFLIIQDSLFFR